MTAIRLEKIRKRFDQTVALSDINLEIAAGELFFLLGPSGCGKSTLLRLLAGLHEPSDGRILFNNQDVTRLTTERRNAVMCFQSYALWPHMTVAENVRFGLSVRDTSRAEQQQRVEEVLRLVQMHTYASRRPNQLSGGQQQRVALARALAVQPACLLLDEPLSNLDTKLRHDMRSEIRRICKSTGLTTVYVTHDQKEALSVADRIAILRDGRLEQVGTPEDLYMRPRNSFVADFIGPTNLISGSIVSQNGQLCQIETGAGPITAPVLENAPAKVILSIRPERIRIASRHNAAPAKGQNRLQGTVKESSFLGDSSEHIVQINSARFKVLSTPPAWNTSGELTLEFDPKDVTVLPE